MLSLYSGSNAISCEYNYQSGAYSEQIIVYVKSGKIYEYSLFSGYDEATDRAI